MVPQREAEKRGNSHTCELEELVKISPPPRNASKLCTIPKMAEEICNPLAPSFVQFGSLLVYYCLSQPYCVVFGRVATRIYAGLDQHTALLLQQSVGIAAGVE